MVTDRRAFMLAPLGALAAWALTKLPQEKRPPKHPSVHVMGDLVVDGEIYQGSGMRSPTVISNCHITGLGQPVIEVRG